MLFSVLTGSIAEQFWASKFYFSILMFYYYVLQLSVLAQPLSLAIHLLPEQILLTPSTVHLMSKGYKKFTRFYLHNWKIRLRTV